MIMLDFKQRLLFQCRGTFGKLLILDICFDRYSTEKQISKARNGFNKRGKHFMLFTERFHFYKR